MGEEGQRRGGGRRAALLLFAAVAGALALGTCREGGDGRGNPGAPLKPSTERRRMAPFDLPDLAGGTYRLADRTRGKVVLVNYWATWCRPCRDEMPFLARLAEHHRARGLEVVGVSVDTDGAPEVVRRYVAENRTPYPVVLGAGDSGIAFSVTAVPFTVLLDRQGRIAKAVTGRLDEATLSADIEALLSE